MASGSRERAVEEGAEHREIGGVGELPEDEVPGAESRAEARDRGEREDHHRPERGRGTRAVSRAAATGIQPSRTLAWASGTLRRQRRAVKGKPVRVRHGPAAVRGDAPPPSATGLGREGGGGGSPESEDLARPDPFPSRKGGSVLHRPSRPSSAACLRSPSPRAAGRLRPAPPRPSRAAATDPAAASLSRSKATTAR